MTRPATCRGRPRAITPPLVASDASPGTAILACIRCRLVTITILQQAVTAIRDRQILADVAMAEHDGLNAEIRRLQALLAEQDRQLDARTAALRAEVQAATAKASALQAALDARHQDAVAAAAAATAAAWSPDELAAIRACATRCHCTVADALLALETLYPDRVVVLASAHRSARQAADFQHPCQAADLLAVLVTTYRDLLVAGRPECEAKQAFGRHAYAATEARNLGRRGTRLRTFTYRGQGVPMLRHLKIGVGEASTTGLRIHFHWDAERRVVVIGHCGAHLDVC